MTPKGVEQLIEAKGWSIRELVSQTMTPKGVEQMGIKTVVYSGLPVSQTMTPKGVEQSPLTAPTTYGPTGVPDDDAQGR